MYRVPTGLNTLQIQTVRGTAMSFDTNLIPIPKKCNSYNIFYTPGAPSAAIFDENGHIYDEKGVPVSETPF